MLKIKNNIDLNELEKFGFKPQYNQDTGELYQYKQKGLDYCYVLLKDRIFNFYLPLGNSRDYKENEYKVLYLLFDLIQAELIEKVEN